MQDDQSNNSGSTPPSTVTVNFKQINATLSRYLGENESSTSPSVAPQQKEVKFRPLKPKLLVMNTTANSGFYGH